MAKTAEIRDLPDEELLTRLEGSKEELFNLRFQLATGQLDNTSRISSVRHEIARILTVLRDRHLESELEQEVARSEQEALERSRQLQASGELKGRPLGEAMTDVPAGAEPPPMGGEIPEGAPGVPTPAGAKAEDEETEKRPRRRLRRKRQDAEPDEGAE